MKNYKIVETEDGSTTLYSKLYDEACHSTSGASSETQTHYIQGCKIEELCDSADSITVFEVGFGVGIGFDETIQVTELKNTFLHFVSVEIDPELIEIYETQHQVKFDFDKELNRYLLKDQNFLLEVYIGDARQSIKSITKNLPSKVDAIYQDAFSPKRNAILWTKEWFEDLLNISNETAIMSTYSASSSIRKSMITAGWKVFNGVKFGPKRASTRACPSGETAKDILERLERSPAVTITDANYETYNLKENKNEKN